MGLAEGGGGGGEEAARGTLPACRLILSPATVVPSVRFCFCSTWSIAYIESTRLREQGYKWETDFCAYNPEYTPKGGDHGLFALGGARCPVRATGAQGAALRWLGLLTVMED